MPFPLDTRTYDTDRNLQTPHLEIFAEYFTPLLDSNVRLLELGVYHGGSLLLWRDVFARGVIAGLDINPVMLDDPSGRIRIYTGGQDDTTLLDRIAAEIAPGGFDIIIDDCAHVGSLARASFWHLFEKHLKPGGIYAIEDWGTGYWDSWPDGKAYAPQAAPEPAPRSLLGKLLGLAAPAPASEKPRFPSHDYGMVGFIKELVDECGYADITCPGRGIEPPRPSRIQHMRISHGLVILVKAKTSA